MSNEKKCGVTVIVHQSRAPGKPVFRPARRNPAVSAVLPFVMPVPGEVRGPFYPENSTQRFMVYGGNGWFPVNQMPWDSEEECRQQAEELANKYKK